MKKESGVAVVKNESGIAQITAGSLERALVEEGKKRELLDKYIADNLKKGIDYDTIPGCGTKPTLLKPGAERVMNLFNLTLKWEFDSEVFEHLPQAIKDRGVICFRCYAVSVQGRTVGEGRGSAQVGEKTSWNLNTCEKIAKKRSMVDCALTVASLSNRFSQDLEDMQKNGGTAPKQRVSFPKGVKPLNPAEKPKKQATGVKKVVFISPVDGKTQITRRKFIEIIYFNAEKHKIDLSPIVNDMYNSTLPEDMSDGQLITFWRVIKNQILEKKKNKAEENVNS